MREAFEVGDTIQFTWVSSIVPDSAPWLFITGSGNTIVASITSVESGAAGYYYALYTIPNSAVATGVYMLEWMAQKTITTSVYPFRKRDLFNVVAPTRDV